jgi:hypothetical protein
LYIHALVIPVAGWKREIIPADLPQFSFPGSRSPKYPLDGPKDAWRFLSRADCIRMLIETYVTAFDELLELIAITKRVETSGPTDKNTPSFVVRRPADQGADSVPFA